ncbi:MAG: M16 family metallopeptidase [Devosiaceae bacterium]
MSEITRLPSGLTLVSEHRPEAETVALGVFVNAGTRDELPEEQGLAHFLEHMAFKGTATRSAFDIVAQIEALGGDINAETSPEATSYTVRMLAEDWQAGLAVLLDIVCHPSFQDQDIALEQDVVMQEIAGAMDVPDDRVVDGLGLAAFGKHAIGQPVLGTEKTVRGLDAQALRTFRKRTYAPENMVVSSAGDLPHDHLVAALQAANPAFPSKHGSARHKPEFQPTSFLEARTTYDTHLAIAWEAPAFAATGSMAHAFAVQMLGGGMTSRLFQSIREEEGLAYGVDAYQMIYADCGLGVVQTATSADQVKPMLARLKAEMQRFADDMREDELASAKRQFRASLAMSNESLPGLCARNARQLACIGTLRSRQSLETEIDATTLADVKSAWQGVMSSGSFAKAAVGEACALDLWANW